jgi:hypothetical protein
MNRNRLLIAAALTAFSFVPAHAQGNPGCTTAATALQEIIRPIARDGAANCPTLVGTWQVTVSPDGAPPFQAVNTFLADGNSVEFDNGNPPGTQTIATGPWQKTGPSDYVMLEVNQIFDPQGNFAGTVQVRATITLDDKGNQFTSKFQVTVLDPDGNTVFQGTGTAIGKRLAIPASA